MLGVARRIRGFQRAWFLHQTCWLPESGVRFWWPRGWPLKLLTHLRWVHDDHRRTHHYRKDGAKVSAIARSCRGKHTYSYSQSMLVQFRGRCYSNAWPIFYSRLEVHQRSQAPLTEICIIKNASPRRTCTPLGCIRYSVTPLAQSRRSQQIHVLSRQRARRIKYARNARSCDRCLVFYCVCQN